MLEAILKLKARLKLQTTAWQGKNALNRRKLEAKGKCGPDISKCSCPGVHKRWTGAAVPLARVALTARTQGPQDVRTAG